MLLEGEGQRGRIYSLIILHTPLPTFQQYLARMYIICLLLHHIVRMRKQQNHTDGVCTMAGCCRRYCSRWTLPAVSWSLLSVVSAVLCSLGLYFSNWLQRETADGTFNSASSFRLCLNESSLLSTSCESYFTFNEIYSAEWKAVTLLMGAGACLLVFTALLSLFVFCVHRFFNACVTCIIGVLQCLGGMRTFYGVAVTVILCFYLHS